MTSGCFQFNIPHLGGKIDRVNNEIRVVDKAGNVVNSAKVTKYDAITPAAYAYWANTGSSPISSFDTTWNVPPAPETNHGQSIFLFPGISSAGHSAVLGPVLQYGPSEAGGGNYWSVASWYLSGGLAYFTPAVGVAAGKSLNGVIALLPSQNVYSYVALFHGIVGTELPVTGIEELVFATEGLEAAGTIASSDFPSGSVVFSPINVNTSNGIPSMTWVPVNDTAAKIITTVDIQGASNASVTISFPA